MGGATNQYNRQRSAASNGGQKSNGTVWTVNHVLKPLQNKKGQKNLGYPRKKPSFYKEKDGFFLGYPKFF